MKSKTLFHSRINLKNGNYYFRRTAGYRLRASDIVRTKKRDDPFGINTTKLTVFLCIVFADYITGVLVAIKQRKISSDAFADTEIQACVLLSLVINEGFSILENLEKINVPIPKIFLSSLKHCKQKKTLKKKMKKVLTK